MSLLGDFSDNPDLGHAYHVGYSAGRMVSENMAERMGHLARRFPDPAAEALKRVLRGRDGSLGPAEAEAVAEGIDDALNCRRPRVGKGRPENKEGSE